MFIRYDDELALKPFITLVPFFFFYSLSLTAVMLAILSASKRTVYSPFNEAVSIPLFADKCNLFLISVLAVFFYILWPGLCPISRRMFYCWLDTCAYLLSG